MATSSAITAVQGLASAVPPADEEPSGVVFAEEAGLLLEPQVGCPGALLPAGQPQPGPATGAAGRRTRPALGHRQTARFQRGFASPGISARRRSESCAYRSSEPGRCRIRRRHRTTDWSSAIAGRRRPSRSTGRRCRQGGGGALHLHRLAAVAMTRTYQALVSSVAPSAGAGITPPSNPIEMVAATTAATWDHQRCLHGGSREATPWVFIDPPLSIHPSVLGRSHQVRVQRWLLPFEQE